MLWKRKMRMKRRKEEVESETKRGKNRRRGGEVWKFIDHSEWIRLRRCQIRPLPLPRLPLRLLSLHPISTLSLRQLRPFVLIDLPLSVEHLLDQNTSCIDHV